MKRKLKFFFVSILSLCVLLLLVAIAVNKSDVPLNPELENILREKPQYSAQQKSAFFFILGLYLHDDKNPQAAGEAIYKQYLSLPEAERTAFWKSHFDGQFLWRDDTYGGCKNRERSCTLDHLKAHPEELEALQQNPSHLQNFIKLLEYGAVADVFEGNAELPFSRVFLFQLDQFRKLQLQMLQWVLDGQTPKTLDMIEKTNRYSLALIANGTLLNRMVGNVQIRALASLLLDILKHQPNLKISAPLLASFDLPDTQTVFLGAMNRELHFLDLFFVQPKLSDFDAYDGRNGQWKDWLGPVPIGIFLRHNETLNNYYVTIREGLKGQPAREVVQWLKAGAPWRWIENPVGRTLIPQLTDEFLIRAKKFSINKSAIDEACQTFREHVIEL